MEDASEAFRAAVAHGAKPVLEPTALKAKAGGPGGDQVISEVVLYGDVVMRFISGDVQVG